MITNLSGEHGIIGPNFFPKDRPMSRNVLLPVNVIMTTYKSIYFA